MSIATDILQRIDFESGINVNYRETTEWYDGTPMDDSKKDDVIFKKKDGKYYQRTFDNLDSKNLIKKTLIDFRDISKTEVLLLKMGVYKSVELQGYYIKGDTPNPILYFLSETIETDNSGDIIEVDGVKFKSFFTNEIDITYFGGKKNDDTFDNAPIINLLLSKGITVTTNNEKAYFTTPITVLNGGSIIKSKLHLKTSINGVFLHRGGSIEDSELSSIGVDMNTKYMLLFFHVYESSNTDLKYNVNRVNIYGNSDSLQGQAMGAEVVKDSASNYALVQFANISNVNIDGFRDAIVLKTDNSNATDGRIVYCNANTFTNINISNCLRPIRMLNQNCTLAQIKSGNVQISGNIFRNIIVQHKVDTYPVVEAQGISTNDFDIFAFDWAGNEYSFDNRCYDNYILNDNTTLSKVGQQVNNAFIKSESLVRAKAVFTGTSGSLSSAYFLNDMTKVGVGSYNIFFAEKMKSIPNVTYTFKDINDFNKVLIVNLIDDTYCNIQVLNNSTGANVDCGLVDITFF